MVDSLSSSGQTFNYGQLNTVPSQSGQSGPAGAGGPGPAGAGALGGLAAPPPIAALADAVKAVLDELTPKGDASTTGNTSEDQADRLQSIVSSSVSGDTATYLARTMMKFYSEQRHDAVLDRQTLGLAAQAELMNSAAQLDHEADKMKSAAIVSLVTTCVASAITIATSGVSLLMKGFSIGKEIKALKGEMGAMKDLGRAEESLANIKDVKEMGKVSQATAGDEGLAAKQVMNAKSNLKSFEVQAKTAEKWAAVAGSIGQIGDAAGKTIAAGGEFNSKMTDSEIKHLEADAKRMDAIAEGFRTQADAKKAIIDALDDMIHQLLSFVKDMSDAKADRMRSIVRA